MTDQKSPNPNPPTDAEITALQVKATAKNDTALVEHCRKALAGDVDACRQCAAAIARGY